MKPDIFKRIVLALVVRCLRRSPNRDRKYVGFIFDYITAKSMLFGRYEDDELGLLETRVFPHMANRRVCLDVGANIGNHSLCFADWFSQVHAFEPHPVTSRVLAINASFKPNIRCHPIAASNGDHVVNAVEVDANKGAARIVARLPDANSDSALRFECRRLDEYLEQPLHELVDFVKIDVEGHELAALEGMEKILASAHPVIAFELFTGTASGEIDFLRALGYRHFYEIRRNLLGSKRLRRTQEPGRRKHKLLLASTVDPSW
ncbi:MAG: FkbM family methyltransferase [Burkholderiaceae bacterium]|nr:FkbM family methyltransferase [Burkholderiaceae bacterium]